MSENKEEDVKNLVYESQAKQIIAKADGFLEGYGKLKFQKERFSQIDTSREAFLDTRDDYAKFLDLYGRELDGRTSFDLFFDIAKGKALESGKIENNPELERLWYIKENYDKMVVGHVADAIKDGTISYDDTMKMADEELHDAWLNSDGKLEMQIASDAKPLIDEIRQPVIDDVQGQDNN